MLKIGVKIGVAIAHVPRVAQEIPREILKNSIGLREWRVNR